MTEWTEFSGTDGAWDSVVESSHGSGFMQSSQWARFKQAEGYRCSRLVWKPKDGPSGQALLLAYPGDGFTVCPEGPCLAWEDEPCCRPALQALIRHVRATNALGLRIEPRIAEPAPRLLKNWSRAAVDLDPVHTLIADLRKSEQERLASLHPKTRYNLRLAWRHGVEVAESLDPADARGFHDLFLETAGRNGFFAEPFSFFLNLAQCLFPSGRARFLFAKKDGLPCSAMVLLICGKRATYLYGASSDERRRFMSTYALHWEAMRVAFREGCTEYDFYGYDPFGHPDHLYAGISRFKRGWGAEHRTWIGARDYLFYDRVAGRVVEKLLDF
jgi:lipid II:glycine glycyltransferase (peptidoglycan interpeptide bridge formation enzyme)